MQFVRIIRWRVGRPEGTLNVARLCQIYAHVSDWTEIFPVKRRYNIVVEEK